MSDNDYENESLTSFDVSWIGVNDTLLLNFTPMEIVLGESLLTPGLQTSVRVHAYSHQLPIRILDAFKNTRMKIVMDKPGNTKYNVSSKMDVLQTTYRLDSRKLYNQNTEEFVIHACDQTLLDDAKTLVSKLWKCTSPSSIVREVLSSCAGARLGTIEPSEPARDYMAENIHPFQVVAQQANAALAGGNDPSFIHYMTYENLGSHHFRSLKALTAQTSMITYSFAETGTRISGIGNPRAIITHAFPCDFDLLSDILNGVDANGKEISSFMAVNPLMKMFNIFGGTGSYGCGIGSGNPTTAVSNEGSAAQQNACPDYSRLYIQKRQARMGLLEQDKIALRLTVPWNPDLHAGRIITLNLPNKEDPKQLNYGSGDYLILHMKHHIKYGGYATTTLDCVSKTVGIGIV
jgi:hypothetical protein